LSGKTNLAQRITTQKNMKRVTTNHENGPKQKCNPGSFQGSGGGGLGSKVAGENAKKFNTILEARCFTNTNGEKKQRKKITRLETGNNNKI